MAIFWWQGDGTRGLASGSEPAGGLHIHLHRGHHLGRTAHMPQVPSRIAVALSQCPCCRRNSFWGSNRANPASYPCHANQPQPPIARVTPLPPLLPRLPLPPNQPMPRWPPAACGLSRSLTFPRCTALACCCPCPTASATPHQPEPTTEVSGPIGFGLLLSLSRPSLLALTPRCLAAFT